MKIYLLGFFCVFTVSISFSKPISYEEVAVTFFTKKILVDNQNPFYNTKIYFNGNTNRSVTRLTSSIIERFPQDSLLIKEYKREIEWMHTVSYLPKEKSVFTISFLPPIQYTKLNYPRKNHAYNLQVEQYKEVNGKYIILLTLVKKKCEEEYFIYIIMDKNQEIIDWFYDKNLN